LQLGADAGRTQIILLGRIHLSKFRLGSGGRLLNPAQPNARLDQPVVKLSFSGGCGNRLAQPLEALGRAPVTNLRQSEFQFE